MLFNTILADLYGQQRLLRDDLLPRELVFPNPAFLRSCWGIMPQGGVFLHMYSADLARSPDGQWWVLAGAAVVLLRRPWVVPVLVAGAFVGVLV